MKRRCGESRLNLVNVVINTMNCRTAEDRLHVAQFWLERIQRNYLDPNETVEYYLEAFLMSCRSVSVYVVRDFQGNKTTQRNCK